MLYKTIVLELLQGHAELHQQLREKRRLLETMNFYANELKATHETWKERLSLEKPGIDPFQVSSMAMEIAVKEMENRIAALASPDDSQTGFLDAALAFLRKATPPS